MSETALFAGSWLLTFLLHSTVWLGGAWLLLRWLFSASPATREWIWKGATLGALLSPTLQLTAPQWFHIDGLSGRFALASEGGAAIPTPTKVAGTWLGEPELVLETVSESSASASGAGTSGTSPSAIPLEIMRSEIHTDGNRYMVVLAGQTNAPLPAGAIGPGSWPEGTAPPDPTDITLSATAASENWNSGAPLWLQILIGLWAAGAIGGVGHWAWRLYCLKRQLRKRMSLTTGSLVRNVQSDLSRFGRTGRRVRLSVSDRIHVPIAFGWPQGEVCLPMRALNDLDAAHQRSMIGHELAHLRRRDPLWITFYNLVQRILFLQPLLLVARREAMHAAEELCDSWACRGTGNRFAMAECLTQVADWLRPEKRDLPVACMAQTASPLERRVERLLDSKAASPDQARAGRAALILVALLLAMAFVAPGVASHFTPAENQTVELRVDLLDADLGLAQARIQYLQTEVTALELELTLADPGIGTGAIRQTLEQLRAQLSLLQQITAEISRDIPATIES
jgi:beta-lactamase regulating signal transducer with metallopeptidase domain